MCMHAVVSCMCNCICMYACMYACKHTRVSRCPCLPPSTQDAPPHSSTQFSSTHNPVCLSRTGACRSSRCTWLKGITAMWRTLLNSGCLNTGTSLPPPHAAGCWCCLGLSCCCCCCCCDAAGGVIDSSCSSWWRSRTTSTLPTARKHPLTPEWTVPEPTSGLDSQ